jgi:hypothetical protein
VTGPPKRVMPTTWCIGEKVATPAWTTCCCSAPKHHHLVHDNNYQVKLMPDATVEITKPDGTVITSRPPNHSPPRLKLE